MRMIFHVLALGMLVCLPACSDRGSQPSVPADATAFSESSGDDLQIQVSVKSREEVRELIESHSGKVVVIDLWALW